MSIEETQTRRHAETWQRRHLLGLQHLSADELNRLYYRLISRKSMIRRFGLKMLGQKNVRYIKSKFPSVYKLASRLLQS